MTVPLSESIDMAYAISGGMKERIHFAEELMIS
jgi:hypothetical protein